MKKVIINADDFGYSTAVNLGIIESFKKGVLTSTTLMANMGGRDEAIRLAKNNTGLGVVCHLVLTCGSPITEGSTIVKPSGEFFSLKEYQLYRKDMNDTEIFNEWCSQIDYLLNQGMVLTHLDSHHHVHTFKENYEITKNISEKYQLCFRNAYSLEENSHLSYQKGITGFFDLMNHKEIRDLNVAFESRKKECFEELQTVFDKVEGGQITELMVHPAFIDESLYFNSSFNIQRIKEVAILCDPELKLLLENQQIELCHYGDIPSVNQ
ncbi:carbohydrate deacetylase [Carnobacterium divergens]|uniref:carbohydrate deacetylase n=1 Tax=Carnobacterium divergens TaxID=2748 RepID=UPI0039C8FF8C